MNLKDPPNGLSTGEATALRELLDAEARSLDAATLSRLNRARQSALESALRPRTRWWSGWAMAMPAAALALLAIWLVPSFETPAPTGDAALAEVEALLIEPAAVDSEWLASDAPSELIDDWEFYAWLDQQQQVPAQG